MPALQQGRQKLCERHAGPSFASRLALQQVEGLMHCGAHVVAIIITIAIVAISMIVNDAPLVAKLLSVSVVQDGALHRWNQLSLGQRSVRTSRRSM